MSITLEMDPVRANYNHNKWIQHTTMNSDKKLFQDTKIIKHKNTPHEDVKCGGPDRSHSPDDPLWSIQ